MSRGGRNPNFWLFILSLVILTGAFGLPAAAQERCFQLGHSECRQSAPGQPFLLHTCEQYRDGLRLTFKGTPCQAEDDITGTWIGTQNCGGEIDEIIYELEATSFESFSGTWEDGSGDIHSFAGSIRGTAVTWRDGDSTYRLTLQKSRAGARLVGTLTWGSYPKPCRVEMTRSN